MLRNEKGFTFLEAIVSLNILIVFCGVIVPSMTLFLEKKEELYINKIADDLLTDSVHLYYLNKEALIERTLVENDQVFSVHLKSINDSKQICVSWIIQSKESEICEDIR